MAGELVGHGHGQRGAGAAAELLHLREHQAIDLGHHPGADGEVGAAQAKHDERRGKGEDAGDDPSERDRNEGVEARHDGECEQQIPAEADERLLPYGDEAGVASEQVPQLRQRQHVEDEDQVLHQRPAGEERQRREQRHEGNADQRRGARGLRGGGDAVGHQSTARGNSPRGLSTSTIRKATWPARICHSGLMWAPMVCATPMMMPPASVPHRLPSPPMITASKA